MSPDKLLRLPQKLYKAVELEKFNERSEYINFTSLFCISEYRQSRNLFSLEDFRATVYSIALKSLGNALKYYFKAFPLEISRIEYVLGETRLCEKCTNTEFEDDCIEHFNVSCSL